MLTFKIKLRGKCNFIKVKRKGYVLKTKRPKDTFKSITAKMESKGQKGSVQEAITFVESINIITWKEKGLLLVAIL
jgi:hypothetical protein